MQHSVTGFRKEREHNLISSPVSILSVTTQDFFRHTVKNLVTYVTSWPLTLSSGLSSATGKQSGNILTRDSHVVQECFCAGFSN